MLEHKVLEHKVLEHKVLGNDTALAVSAACRQYDAVTALEVIEHLAKPAATSSFSGSTGLPPPPLAGSLLLSGLGGDDSGPDPEVLEGFLAGCAGPASERTFRYMPSSAQ